jgi:hypothetical protein
MTGEGSTINFDHAFAIVRLDVGMAGEFGMRPDFVTVKKVVRTEEEAEREVARLNAINEGKGSVYHWQITRLERDRDAETRSPRAGDVEGDIRE